MRTQDTKKGLKASIMALFVAICLMVQGSPLQAEQLNWTTNYNEAVETAKQQNKPLFLYFTGSDWCSWCKKMDKEILTDRYFVSLVDDKFVFVMLDFPEKKKLSDELKKQNDALQNRFKIEGYPTVVLLDPNQQEIAKLNYREGGGKKYAEYLLKILDDQKQFQKGMKNLNKLSALRLRELYEIAKSKARKADCQQIMLAGLLQNDNLFFLKEEYRVLLSTDDINSPEVQKIRKELLAKDPDNKNHLHCEVAILDFESLARNISSRPNADEATKPLKDYLTAYGEDDPEHRFRIEMIIAQTYHYKNQFEQARLYAEASLEHAPKEMKPLISQALLNIEQDKRAIAESDD